MKKVLGLAISCLFASTAFAIPITFEFGEEGTGSIISCCGDDDYDRYVANVNGVDLTVRGYTDVVLDPPGSVVSGEFNDRERVTRDTSNNHQGLGVHSEMGDSGRINGGDYDEALRFFLSVPGTLTRIVFNNWNLNNYEEFDLSVDGIGVLNNEESSNGSNVWTGSIAFNSRFAIGADSSNEHFRIRSITIDTYQRPVSAIPEPGTLALLGAGLLALAFARRRRRR